MKLTKLFLMVNIIPSTRPLTINHANIISNTRPLTTNHTNQQMVADNIYFAKTQTLLADKKKHKLDKIPIIDPFTKDSREKVTKQKLICYKCNKIGHYHITVY